MSGFDMPGFWGVWAPEGFLFGFLVDRSFSKARFSWGPYENCESGVPTLLNSLVAFCRLEAFDSRLGGVDPSGLFLEGTPRESTDFTVSRIF